jgi:murein DD-endopeptidase MepM/ murein hydrolase activator NlpD
MNWRHDGIRRLAGMFPITIAIAVTASSSTAADREALLRQARQIRDQVARGESAPLWSLLDAGMRQTVKDSAAFVAMGTSIHGQLGALDSLIGEEVIDRDSLLIVRTSARFAKAPVPVAITIGLTPAGLIRSLHVGAAAAAKEAPSAFLDYQPKAHFELPFRGEWLCFWGGRTVAENYHAAHRAQRFAYDLVMVREGSTHSGEGKALTDYYCYGQPILAPAAGTVVTIVDSLPDQAIGSRDPMNAAGNHVVIDHGNREYSLLAHLQPRSLKVRIGQRVKPGDVLGLAGNSGNTSEPHLHVHLMNGPSMQEADGLPMPFDGYDADGTRVTRGEPRRMQKLKRPGS